MRPNANTGCTFIEKSIHGKVLGRTEVVYLRPDPDDKEFAIVIKNGRDCKVRKDSLVFAAPAGTDAETRTCRKCHDTKSLSEFGKTKNNNHRHECKQCRRPKTTTRPDGKPKRKYTRRNAPAKETAAAAAPKSALSDVLLKNKQLITAAVTIARKVYLLSTDPAEQRIIIEGAYAILFFHEASV